MKVLSRKLMTLCFILGLTVPMAMAQKETANKELSKEQRQERREKVEELKKEFFTKELELTDAEAKEFWPIYDAMQKEMRDLHKKEKTIAKEMKENFDTMSDSDVEKKMQELFSIEEKIVAVKRTYHAKFVSVIGQKRAAKLIHLEHRFKKELLSRMKKGDGPHKQGKPSPPGDKE